MPKFEDVKAWFDAVVKLFFADDVPTIVTTASKYALLAGLLVLGLWGVLHVVAKIRELWLQSIRPIFYDAEARRLAEDRRRFAEHVKAQLDSLNSRESWQDYRFAELEAEVEAEGRTVGWITIPYMRPTRKGLRRERSLALALKSSRERLSLLEGEPGSGKSVALRHVAISLAESAMKTRSSDSIIPIYINLKGINRKPGTEIDRNLIEKFVLAKMAGNDRDLERFLETEFERGMRRGTWLFLFDSFDEIADILSSTEADETIRTYAEAIRDFLFGLNECRGIVASRGFRGPGRLPWPRFRIKPLSPERRRELVRNVNLDRNEEKELLVWLETAAPAARRMASNPMFLGLVANHVRNEHEFPDSPHSIFDSYIERRLKSDQDRIRRRYGLSSDDLRVTAEHIAFAMAADEGVGLNPSRDRLREAMSRVGLHTGVDITVAMDALEYIKLARSESGEPGDPASFTFAHRRFQEYFSTCVLLREPGRVGPRQLLTDARWREALVVMCQTQDPAVLAPVVAEVDRLLDEKVGWLATQKELTAADELADFPWPVGTIHLSSIIQDGFGSRLSELPHHIREKIGFILKSAFTSGSRLDRKWALDVAGPAPSETLHAMVRAAFASDSQWLRNSAYHQVARLDAISSDIAKSIREALVAMGRNGTLRVDRIATSAHLARLDRSSEFLSTLRKLVWISPISAAMHLVAVVSVLTLFPASVPAAVLVFALLVSGLTIWLPWSFLYKMRLIFAATTGWIGLVALAGLIDPVRVVDVPILRVASFFICAYAWSWGPLAIRSASIGECSSPIAWPLEPFIRIWGLRTRPKAWLQRLRERLRKDRVSLSGAVGFLVVMWVADKYDKADIVLIIICGVSI